MRRKKNYWSSIPKKVLEFSTELLHKCTRASLFLCTPQTHAYGLWCNLHKRDRDQKLRYAQKAYLKRDDIQYAPWLVWVATCWRLHSWTSKMLTRITNLESILHTHMCCERVQENSPTVDVRLGLRIPILWIRITRDQCNKVAHSMPVPATECFVTS
jgi:hypothetical protein